MKERIAALNYIANLSSSVISCVVRIGSEDAATHVSIVHNSLIGVNAAAFIGLKWYRTGTVSVYGYVPGEMMTTEDKMTIDEAYKYRGKMRPRYVKANHT